MPSNGGPVRGGIVYLKLKGNFQFNKYYVINFVSPFFTDLQLVKNNNCIYVMLLGCFDHIESDSSLHHTSQSQTPRCITQPRVGLLAVSHSAESDSSLHHTAQSQTPRCITQPRVGLLAASHSPELDSSLHHTVQSWTPRSILRTVEIMNTKSQKI